MAAEKKGVNTAYKKLLADIAAGTPERLYVFYGEESYLKSHYLGKLRELCAGDFAEFNSAELEGDRLSAEEFFDATDSLPFGSERKIVTVRDFKLMQPPADFKERLPELFAAMPEYLCLVFWFDAQEFKPDKRLAIYKALEKHGQLVDFEPASGAELTSWLRRRFKAAGKSIGADACEYMMFLCGASMTNLITEVEKIAAGTPGAEVTRQDIDRLGSRVLEADIFQLTDLLAEKKYGPALVKLRELFDMQNAPAAVLGAVARQYQRLYGARLAADERKGEAYVAEMFGFRSSYPARRLIAGASRMSLAALRRAQELCMETDLAVKSNMPDAERALELLLLRLSQVGK